MSPMILEKLAEAAGRRVEADKRKLPFEEIRRLAEEAAKKADTEAPCAGEDAAANALRHTIGRRGRFAFEAAFQTGEMGFICEVKKASPSKGVIAEEFPYLRIAREYEQAGASCISVLTEPEYFLGLDSYLAEIREVTGIPLLRKDFTVDTYQIYQAKLLGADCVLLICALTGEEKLREYLAVCDSLGLSALTEAHDEAEIEMAVRAGARMVGVNNRNLKDFSVDLGNSGRLRNLVPEDRIFIAESGIRTAQDVKQLRDIGVNGALIGETLMRSPDKKAMLQELKGIRYQKEGRS